MHEGTNHRAPELPAPRQIDCEHLPLPAESAAAGSVSGFGGLGTTFQCPPVRAAPPASSRQSRAVCITALGFWACGLLNNYAYVVFLAAAEDLLTGRSGAVLMAETLPGVATSTVLPFFMHMIPYGVRVCLVSTMMASSFLAVALAESPAARLAGISIASVAQQLGETTFLALSGRFPPSAVGSWSSGTGAAGLVGAGAWMLLKRVMHLSTETSLLLLSPASLMVAIVYACLLSPSDKGCATWNGAGARGHQAHVKESFHSSAASPLLQSPADDDHLPGSPTHADGGRAPADSVSQVLLSRMGILRALLVPYMVPLMVVYFFEYSINQAMFLPLGFAISRQGSHQVQDACGTYSYLQLLYQVGVLVSRSSVHCVPVPRLWPLPVLQGANSATALLLVLLYGKAGRGGSMTPLLGLMALVMWEGLLGGATYVNAYTQISKRYSCRQQKEFALGMTAMADSVGVMFAGGVSLLVEPLLLGYLGVDSNVRC